jgi:cation-transporting ATPase E
MSAETAAPAVPAAQLDGLDAAAVAERVGRGQVNQAPSGHSRTTWDILRANVLTRFNALLGSILVLALIIGPLQDAVFGVILVVNTAVGVVQEVRAKRTLDRLAVLNAPKARLVRSGELREAPVGEIVIDDVLELRQGDQIPVDGTVLASTGLEVDESLLTGEADSVLKEPGSEVLSGSVVVAGAGRFQVTRLGADAYARKLADEAKRFKMCVSELRNGINRVLVYISWVILPTAAILAVSQFRSQSDVLDGIRASIAGVVGMVPEGLVLLTSVAFAAAVVRLGRRDALVQELPAVELLARVDVICLDKTGTITDGDATVREVETMGPGDDHARALRAVAGADDHPNASLRAIAAAFPPDPGATPRLLHAVPFSSSRKWSGATFEGLGTCILGAPEIVLGGVPQPGDAQSRVDAHASDGMRVIMFARSATPLTGPELPSDMVPGALVVIEERVRPDAADTIGFFAAQGVAVKVISGDSPRTVGAVARRVGVPAAESPFDARSLPTDPVELGNTLEGHSVFGRVTPHQKRAMVRALQANGHTVAMTGDGVNDVLALKEADIGIAMGSGSPASRAVAPLVLLSGSFAILPHAVAEGRRVIANVERVADLFLSKTMYATLLAIAVGLASVPFPFLPRHLTIVAALTIGIPGFFLALAPNARRARPGFLNRILRFAVPAGSMAALSTFVAYEIALHHPGVSLVEARTTATLVLVALGLWILSALLRPLSTSRLALLGAMAAGAVLAPLVPLSRRFFDIALPDAVVLLEAGSVALVAVLAGEIAWHLRNRHPLHGALAHALPSVAAG